LPSIGVNEAHFCTTNKGSLWIDDYNPNSSFSLTICSCLGGRLLGMILAECRADAHHGRHDRCCKSRCLSPDVSQAPWTVLRKHGSVCTPIKTPAKPLPAS